MRLNLLFLITMAICSCQTKNKEYDFLKKKIELGLDKEQGIRDQLMNSIKEGNIDLDLNQKMGEIDSVNQIYAYKFLNNYGYPAISKDGRKLSDGIFYILQHSSQQTMKKYINSLKEMAYNEEASLTHYGMMHDRILMNDGKKQTYGSQVCPRKDENGYNTSNYFIWPIQNVKIVDSLRNKMGFKDSIAEYAILMEAEYDKNEELPKK